MLLLLSSLAVCGAMDFETYSQLKLATPFEAKDRTKFDSGMENVNREPGNGNKARGWQALWAVVEMLAYPLPPISQFRPLAPRGTVTPLTAWTKSRVYPGTRRNWWHYVPAQYDRGTAANLIIFNDGQGFLDPNGNYRATIVLDNLIADGLLPPTIAVFLSPGLRPGHPDCAYSNANPPVEISDDPQRSLEYDSVSDRYSRFLLEDILPVLEAKFNITQDPGRRAVLGVSSSAPGSFGAAWFRPDKFGLVATFVGSFVNIRGAHQLPWVVRNTLRKPIRVALHSGSRDMDNNHGSWALGNKEMAAALRYAGYDYRFSFGPGPHYGSSHAGSHFAETLLWLFQVDSRWCPQCHAETGGLVRNVGRAIFWLFSEDGSDVEL